MGDKALWSLVCNVGKTFSKRSDDLEPLYQSLLDNWYDSPEALTGTAPEELVTVGIPLRFAKELVAAAADSASRSGSSAEKGRGKGKAEEPAGKGHGKGKKGERRQDGEHEHILELEAGIDPGFNLKRLLVGEGGRNVHHIQDQTGCRVDVEAGHGGEPTNIRIRGPTKRALDKAVEQASDLANSVYGQYEEWLEEKYGPALPKGNGKGKDKDKGKGKGKSKGGKDGGKDSGKDSWKDSGKGGKGGNFRERVDTWDADPAFRLGSRIVGESGRNLHHIQDQTGAQVWIKDHQAGPPFLEVTAPSKNSLAAAVDLCKDLLTAIHDDFQKWTSQKGSGKRRTKGQGFEDPPAKRGRY